MLSDKTIKKYNTVECHLFQYDEEGLKGYREVSHRQYGLPRFEHDFLRGRPSQKMDLLDKYPELIFCTKDNHFKISPSSSKDYEDLKNKIKNPQERIKLLAWAIHPSQRNEDMLETVKRSKILHTLKEKEGDLRYYSDQSRDRADSNSFARGRTNSQLQQTIADLEKESGKPYLASILDLTSNDIESLENLKEASIKHLREQYSVENEDDMKMFFHFPYPEDTVTLHMHIRVNDTQHDLDKSASFSIDEILESLKKEGSVIPLLLSRKCINPEGVVKSGFHKDIEEDTIFSKIPGITINKVPNPFYNKDLSTKKLGTSCKTKESSTLVDTIKKGNRLH